MKLYFASIDRGILVKSPYAKNVYKECVKAGVQYGLASYFYVKDNPSFLTDEERLPHLFLDSGAYSAHNSGAKVDLTKYCDFIKEHEKNLDVYGNLDVIGSAEDTFKNQELMEKEGLHPLPTFHFGEDFKWLDTYLDAGYKYIALGGLVGKRHKHRLAFCKKAFERIPHSVQVHGYGMTSPRVIDLFPWYSVDSINWMMGRIQGALYYYDRGSIGKLRTNKIVGLKEANTTHMTTERWNIMQWRKYQEHLSHRKPWGDGGV
jgi:hypothetical protein